MSALSGDLWFRAMSIVLAAEAQMRGAVRQGRKRDEFEERTNSARRCVDVCGHFC